MANSVMEEPQDKACRIIEVAQKRFGQYGFEKTTINDIASDLKMSKGSLYYYFPDKEHIYIAVIQKEHDLFIHMVNEKIALLSDPSEMIREYVHVRLAYFRSFLNLSKFRHDNYWELHAIMRERWAIFKVQEETLIIDILKLGVEKEYFEIKNIPEISELLLDTIRGLSIAFIKNNEIFYLEASQYDLLVKKIDLLLDVFIKSLKK